jgi:hypothetical protein
MSELKLRPPEKQTFSAARKVVPWRNESARNDGVRCAATISALLRSRSLAALPFLRQGKRDDRLFYSVKNCDVATCEHGGLNTAAVKVRQNIVGIFAATVARRTTFLVRPRRGFYCVGLQVGGTKVRVISFADSSAPSTVIASELILAGMAQLVSPWRWLACWGSRSSQAEKV